MHHATKRLRHPFHPHQGLEPLEARALLASTQTFDDEDGDRVTVKVTGPGEAVLTLSNGATGLLQFLALTGTTSASAVSISVKQTGAGDGRVIMNDVTHDVPLKSFLAPTTDTTLDVDLRFTEIRSFSLFGLGFDVTVQLIAPAGQSMALVIAVIAGGLDLVGPVSSLRATNTEDTCSVTCDSPMSKVQVVFNMDGSWEAERFGSITVGSTLAADVRARTPDAKGYSFGAVRIGNAELARVRTAQGGIDGRIKSFTSEGDVDGGEINVLGIDTLRCNDDFRPESLRLTESAPDRFCLKTARIFDNARGEWQLGGPVGTLSVGGAEAELDVTRLSDNVHIKSLTFTNPSRENLGSWEICSVGTLTSKGLLGGEWELNSLVPDTSLAVRSINAARIEGMTFAGDVFGGIGTLTANHIQNSDLVARFITTINVKRGIGGEGDVIGSRLWTFGDDGAAFSIRTLNVAREAGDSLFITRSNVKSATFGKFLASTLFVGHQNPLAKETPPDFGDVTQADINATLGSFTVKGPFNAGNKVFGLGVNVFSAHINKITIGGFIDPANGGQTQGITSGLFGPIKFKDAVGGNVSLDGTTLIGGAEPLFPEVSTDMVFLQLT